MKEKGNTSHKWVEYRYLCQVANKCVVAQFHQEYEEIGTYTTRHGDDA